MNKTKSPTLFKNIKYNSFLRIYSLLLSLVTAVFYFKFLNSTEFGVYAIILTLASYFSIFDFGLSRYLIVWFSSFDISNEKKDINLTISTVIAFYFILWLVFLVLFFLNEQFILELLNISEFSKSLWISIILIFFLVSTTWANSLLISLNKAYVLSKINIITISIFTFLSLAILFIGVDFNWFIFIICIQPIASNIIQILYLKLQYDICIFSFNNVYLKTINKILKTSWKYQIDSLSPFFLNSISKIILASNFGPSTVGYYELAYKYANSVTRVFSGISSLIIPEISTLSKTFNKIKKISGFYLRGTRNFALVLIPSIFYAGLLSNIFFEYFFNIDSGTTQQISIILLVSYLIQNLSVFKSATLMAMGKINYMMFSSLAVLLSFLIFNNIFIKEFNEIGMAYSILFSTFIGEIIIWIVFHKIVIKRSLFKSFEIIIFKPLFISLILYAFIDYVILQISNNLLGMMFSLIYPIAIVLLYHLFSIINVKNYIKKGPNLL